MPKQSKQSTYRVETWSSSDNCYIQHSAHKNEDHAKINAEVVSKSRKCEVRVIYEGSIIYLVKG